MDVPKVITCVDCGEKAHLLSHPPEDGWVAGDIVAYRCSGCRDRWDLVVEEPGDYSSSSQASSDFDFRAWLEERRKANEEGG